MRGLQDGNRAEFPNIYYSKDADFAEILDHMVKHLGNLRMEHDKLQKPLANVNVRTATRQAQFKRKEKRVQKKFDFVVEGLDEETKEKQKKRRRQLYHLKKAVRPKKAAKRNVKRKLVDASHDMAPPAKARRLIFIEDKLKVIKFVRELKAKQEEAKRVLKQSMTSCTTVAEREELRTKKQKAKITAKLNVQAACEEQFKDIVGKAVVYKWLQACERESWEELPEAFRVSQVSTPNGGRR